MCDRSASVYIVGDERGLLSSKLLGSVAELSSTESRDVWITSVNQVIFFNRRLLDLEGAIGGVS